MKFNVEPIASLDPNNIKIVQIQSSPNFEIDLRVRPAPDKIYLSELCVGIWKHRYQSDLFIVVEFFRDVFRIWYAPSGICSPLGTNSA